MKKIKYYAMNNDDLRTSASMFIKKPRSLGDFTLGTLHKLKSILLTKLLLLIVLFIHFIISD